MSKRFLIEYELGVSRKVERAQVLSGEKQVSPAVEKMNQINAATRRRYSAAIAAHKALTQPTRASSSSKLSLSIETDFASPTYARPQSPKPTNNASGLSIDVNFTPGERPSSRNGSSRPITNTSAKVESMETPQDRILQKLAMSPYAASSSAKSPKLRPISQGATSVLRLHRMVAQLEKNPIPVSASRPPPSPIGRRSPNRRKSDLQHMLELTDVYNIPLEVIETQVSPVKPIPALSPVSSPSRPKSGVTRPLSAVKLETQPTPAQETVTSPPVKEDPPTNASQPPLSEAESNHPQVESKENEAGNAVEVVDKPGTDGDIDIDIDDAAGEYGDDFYDDDNAGGSSKKAAKETELVPTVTVESTPSTDGVEESKSGQSARPVDVPPTAQPTAPADTAKPTEPPSAAPVTSPLSQSFEEPKPVDFIPITPAHVPALPLSLAEHRASQRSVHSRSMQSRGSRKSTGMEASASSAAACPSFYRSAKGLERDIHRLEQIEAGAITADEWTRQFNGPQELPRWNDRFGFDRSALAKAEIPKLGHEHRQMQLQEHLRRLQQKKEKRDPTASAPERPPRRPKSAAPASPSQTIVDPTAPKPSKEPRRDEDGTNNASRRTGSQQRKRRSSAGGGGDGSGGGGGTKLVPLTSTSSKDHRRPAPLSIVDHDDDHDDGKFF